MNTNNSSASQSKFPEQIAITGIVPVVALDHADSAVPLAKALLAGGINFMEITFRTRAAAQAIANVSHEVPDMHVGAGTVLTMTQCVQALENGAQFIVAPGFSADIVRYCQENEIPVVPGCVTPTEITECVRMGLSMVKFFPAKLYGGVSAIKALHAPFPDLKFLPTGGVNSDNMEEYLKLSCVSAVGGSWVCPKDLIEDGRFAEITALSREATDRIRARNA